MTLVVQDWLASGWTWAPVGRTDLGAGPQEIREEARSLHASLGRLLSLDPDKLGLTGHTSEPVTFDRVPIVRRYTDRDPGSFGYPQIIESHN